jgi:signal transduction histidine kinase
LYANDSAPAGGFHTEALAAAFAARYVGHRTDPRRAARDRASMNSRIARLAATLPVMHDTVTRHPLIDLRLERLRAARLEYRLQEEVGQQLAGIAMLLAAARHAAPPEDDAAREAMDQVARLLDDAITRCRVTPHGD